MESLDGQSAPADGPREPVIPGTSGAPFGPRDRAVPLPVLHEGERGSERPRTAGAQAWLAAIVEGSEDAILGKTLEGTITSWNPGATRLFGYTSDEMIGRPVWRLLPPTRLEEEKQILLRLKRGERVEPYETVRRHKDGRLIEVSLSISPIQNGEGRIVGASKIARDITLRKTAEAAMRHAHEQLREQAAVLERAPVLVRDLDNRIVQWTLGAERLYGFSKAEALGRVSHELFYTEFPQPLAQIDGTLRDTGQWQGQLVHRKRNGERLVVASQWVLHRDPAGNAVRILETNADLTGRQAAEQSLRELNAQLERRVTERTHELAAKNALLARSNADLEQFAAVASHDLQEPLRAMAGCAQMLQRRYAGQLDERAQELIAMVVAGAARMKALIADLLTYSQAGQPARLENIDTGEVLQQTLVNLASALHECQAEVTSDGLPSLRFTRAPFAQVLQNLVGNALKYRRDVRPRIHLQATRQGEGWVFRVTDNGMGFEPHDAEKIFGLFQRLHTREAPRGTGIGLALVKKVIERRGGKIWAESTPGQGSTFSFSVPDQEAPAPPPDA